MSKLTFEEFQATRTAKTWDQARCQAEGTDEVSMDVLEYEDGYIECLPQGMYQLTIGSQSWCMTDLESLENLLYVHWYLDTESIDPCQ